MALSRSPPSRSLLRPQPLRTDPTAKTIADAFQKFGLTGENWRVIMSRVITSRKKATAMISVLRPRLENGI